MATAKETMENQVDAELDFASMLDNYVSSDMGDLEEGSIVEGVIVRVDDDNVLVDVNFKSEGQIPAAEFRDAQGNIAVSVGDHVNVYVARKNEMDGTITLSFEKAKRMQIFDQLEEMLEKNGVIKGTITRRIKGGYTVDLGGVEAFPARFPCGSASRAGHGRPGKSGVRVPCPQDQSPPQQRDRVPPRAA